MMCFRNMWLILVAAVPVLRGPLGTSAAESPCPDVFQYVRSPGLEYGIITLPNHYPYLAIDLSVSIYVSAPVSSIGFAKLNPVGNDIWQKLAAGSRDLLLYRLDFPVSSTLPTIKTININNNIICTGSKPNAEYVSTVTLQHVINNEKCNSASLDCPFSIQQSAEIRPQPSPSADRGDTNTRCGIPATSRVRRVVNGQDSVPAEWPWHAAVYVYRDSNIVYWCGGTFVGTRTIITAAHCVTTTNGKLMSSNILVVSLGRYDLSILEEEGTQKKDVQRIIRHPAYSYTTFDANIALLILSSSVEYTRFVRPVCLWNPSDTSLESVVGINGVVVGWGKDENGLYEQKLKTVITSIVSRDACYNQDEEFYMRYLHTKAFCAGFPNGGTPCNGDSGGGLVIQVGEQGDSKVWKIRGVVSNTRPNVKKKITCDPDSYTIFTDVAQYLSWISVNII